jgi:hypothetical protein
MRADKLKKWAISGALALLTFAVILTLNTGCSQNPTESTADHADATLQWLNSRFGGDGPELSGTYDSIEEDPSFVADAAAKEEFDRSGGFLKIQLDNEEIYFVIPANAVDREVEIEIRGWKLDGPNGEVFLYECFPSGLQFNVPLRVNHPIDKADDSWGVLFYQPDGDGAVWHIEQVTPIRGGRATFEIHHFSKYGIS